MYFFFKIGAIYDGGWRGCELGCSAAGSTTAVILAVKNIFSIMNKFNKIRIIFQNYWILINLCQLKVGDRIFHKKKEMVKNWPWVRQFLRYQKTRTYFSRTKKCAKFQANWMKIEWNMVLKKRRHNRQKKKLHCFHTSRYVQKKFLVTFYENSGFVLRQILKKTPTV